MNIDIINSESFSLAKIIVVHFVNFLENLEKNVSQYSIRADKALVDFKSNNEFYLNKMHKAVVSRVSDYMLILKTVHTQIFDEMIPLLHYDSKAKITKKDHINSIN